LKNFAKLSYNKFHENPQNVSVADTRS